MSQDQPNRDVLALRRLEAEIANGRIQVYRNLLGQPYVIFDINGKIIDDTHPAVHLHLFHADVRAWLTQFIWKTDGLLLHQRELDRMLQALAGLSLREKVEQVTDPAILELLENEPTVAVIVEFMHAEKRRKLELSMELLWKTLREFGRERGLLVRGNNRFPAGANVLSRKLNRFKEPLRRLNIQFTTIRSNGCKVVLGATDIQSGLFSW